MSKHEMNKDPNLLLKPVVLTPEEAQQVAGGMYRFVEPIPVPKSPIPWDDLPLPSLPPIDHGTFTVPGPGPTFPAH
jgi:hypothetical protein